MRATAGAAAAEAEVDRAQADWLVTAMASPTVGELEHAATAIEVSSDQARACEKVAVAERDRAQLAARAWQRADVALAKARVLQHAVVAANEAREHDELAARRKR